MVELHIVSQVHLSLLPIGAGFLLLVAMDTIKISTLSFHEPECRDATADRRAQVRTGAVGALAHSQTHDHTLAARSVVVAGSTEASWADL